MKWIVVVCTGNVARSPALGWLLAEKLPWPEWQIHTAAVGENAVAGLRMRRHMRELMSKHSPGASDYAELHRSQLLADALVPDVYIAVAPVHVRRLQVLAPGVPCVLTDPVIPDPAFGGAERYAEAWQLMQQAASRFDTWFSPGMLRACPGL